MKLALGALIVALALPAQPLADAGPVRTTLSTPGDQPLQHVFSVRIEGNLPGGRGDWSYQRDGVPTMDAVITPHWSVTGRFSTSGPVETVGDPNQARAGDRDFVTQSFRCTAAGAAQIDFSGSISYSVVTASGGVLRFGNIPLTENGRPFQCLAKPVAGGTGVVVTPPGASVGTCSPELLQTEYGTFGGRIWREPGTDPMAIPQKIVIKTEVTNSFRDARFGTAPWSLSGDLWQSGGTGVAPRHANGGNHPWLYVGTPAQPYRGEATFACANHDIAGLTHVMSIRWPDPNDPTAPLREATLNCWVPPFWCVKVR